MKNSFEILGISPTDDKRAIKKAYSELLKKYHPEEFPEKFAEISEAYKSALYCSPAYYADYTDTDQENYEEYVWENNFNIFKDEAEGTFEESEQAHKTLEELRLFVMEARLIKSSVTAVVNEFTESEAFNQLKRDVVFLNGLLKLLPHLRLNIFQIRVLKKALNIKKHSAKYQYQDDLNFVLTELRKFFSKIYKGDISTVIAIITAAVILPFIFGELVFSEIRSSERTSYTVESWMAERRENLWEVLTLHIDIQYGRNNSLNGTLARAHVIAATTEQLQETAGGSIILLTEDFDFLQGNFTMPQRIEFMHRPGEEHEYQLYWAYLCIHFI
jgi:hypothetical protein